MNKTRLISKIIGCLALVALVAVAGAKMLSYELTLREKIATLEDYVKTTAGVISAVADYTNATSDQESPQAVFATTIQQIRQAFSSMGLSTNESEVMIVQRDGQYIKILVHQHKRSTNREHPDRIKDDIPYAAPFADALVGDSGYTWIDDFNGDKVLLVFAPVASVGLAVVVETPAAAIISPFAYSAAMAFGLALFAVLIGALFIYLNTGPTIERALHAQAVLDVALMETEQAEERLRTAFESMTNGLIFIDDKGRIEGFNPAAESMFGYRADEVIGQNVSILMPDEHALQHDGYMQAYHATGKAKVIGTGRELTAKQKSGEIFPIHLGVSEMNVRVTKRFVGSVSDLSAQKSLENQLRRSQKMEAIGQLTGGIAHDFNNLLGIIIGNLDLARRKLEEDSELFRQVDKAITAANRGATLTRRLLSFSRKTSEDLEATDINEVVSDLRELISRSITTDIDIRLNLADGLWPANINKGDFEDAMINLAINARDAMPDGGTLTIETRNMYVDKTPNPAFQKLAHGPYVEVAVTDTGTGMPPEVAERIFEPFFSTKDTGKGTGLGLSMVYGFVQRCSGAVSVYSELGEGTAFRIYLPRAKGDVENNAADDDAMQDAELVGGTESILIVDDEPDLAEIAEAVLSELGYTTRIAYSGADALALFNGGQKIDMLLTDVIMPGGINGFQLAAQVVGMRPEVKVLLVSGFTGGFKHDGDAAANEHTLLRKPYNGRELALEVRRVLDAKAAHV